MVKKLTRVGRFVDTLLASGEDKSKWGYQQKLKRERERKRKKKKR